MQTLNCFIIGIRPVCQSGSFFGHRAGLQHASYRLGAASDQWSHSARAGRITQREARRLQSRERDIARLETRFKRDGVVTPQERRQLRNEVTRLSNDVQRMMNSDRIGRR